MPLPPLFPLEVRYHGPGPRWFAPTAVSNEVRARAIDWLRFRIGQVGVIGVSRSGCLRTVRAGEFAPSKAATVTTARLKSALVRSA